MPYSFTPFPEVTTKRLLLRKLSIDDAPMVYFLRSDERVIKHLCREPAPSIQAAREFIQLIQSVGDKGESILWAMALKNKPGELIGTICLWNLQPENFRGEIGYVLHPDHWGKGIMKEAIDEVLNYGFKVMKLHSVEARLNAENISSTRLLEKAGFVKEGWLREDVYYKDRFLDTFIYSKLVNQHTHDLS